MAIQIIPRGYAAVAADAGVGTITWGIISSVTYDGVPTGTYHVFLSEPLNFRELSIQVVPRGTAERIGSTAEPVSDTEIVVKFALNIPFETPWEITLSKVDGFN